MSRTVRRTDPAPGSGSPPPHLARGALHARHIVFMVVAAAAPMAVVVAIMPIAFFLGNGVGTPGMFLVAALVLALFSVGYVRMIPYVRNAGAFYAYIVHGLGRPTGLVAAYVAAVCYNALAAATCGALAFFAADTANRLFGIDLRWQVWAAIAIAIVAFLGYRRITLTARVLGVALACEVVILLVLDVAILIDNGPSAFSLQSSPPATSSAASSAWRSSTRSRPTSASRAPRSTPRRRPIPSARFRARPTPPSRSSAPSTC